MKTERAAYDARLQSLHDERKSKKKKARKLSENNSATPSINVMIDVVGTGSSEVVWQRQNLHESWRLEMLQSSKRQTSTWVDNLSGNISFVYAGEKKGKKEKKKRKKSYIDGAQLPQSFQINSKRRRAENFPASNGRYLICKSWSY